MPTKPDILLDTGPLVALLDARDSWHERCLVQWHELGHRCLTTDAVVTEATHLVARGGAPAHVPLDFILASSIPIVPLEVSGHRYATRLMRHYSDTPMDYADATLVVVADVMKLRRIFTLDRRGFGSYKRSDGKDFAIVP